MAATVLAVAAGPAGAAPAADLSVALSRTPVVGQAAVDPVTYTAVVTNNGPNSAQQVTFVDPLEGLYPAVQAVSTTAGTCETDPFQQISCSIGTLASGASATVTMRLLITRSGLVSNSVAVISATADPDDENNIATASVVLSEPPSYEEFIATGYFKLVLGLDITDEQLDRWTEKVDEYSYQDFALELLKTYTFRSNWVDETFQKLLGRSPDAGALAVFTRQLSQRVTYEQIEATIAGSNEYYTKSGGTPQAFVTKVVTDFTGHPPTADFRAELLGRLADGQSRTAVASRVVTSGLGRLAWVKWQFRRYYKREVRAFEAHIALDAFRQGTRPAQELANLLGNYEIVDSFIPGYYYDGYAAANKKAA
jgi:uncharacterized repeat protein (TIGR01451 family)